MALARRNLLGMSATGLLLVAAGAAVADEDATAPDVVAFCEPTLEPALVALGAAWRRRTGVPLRLFPSPTYAIVEQATHHIRVDFLVGCGAEPEAVAGQRGLIQAGSRLGGWHNRLVIAHRGAAGAPADPATAVGQGTLAIVDAPVAPVGAASRAALQSLGLYDGLQSRLVGVIDTPDAADLLARGKVDRALIYATDVAASPTLGIAAQIPDSAAPAVDYWIVQTSFARSPNSGRFGAFLREPEAIAILRASGLEVTT